MVFTSCPATGSESANNKSFNAADAFKLDQLVVRSCRVSSFIISLIFHLVTAHMSHIQRKFSSELFKQLPPSFSAALQILFVIVAGLFYLWPTRNNIITAWLSNTFSSSWKLWKQNIWRRGTDFIDDFEGKRLGSWFLLFFSLCTKVLSSLNSILNLV